MFNKIKEYFFPFLVALSAFSLAGAAAFFSVTGLSKLFGGAQGAVIIMASSLEFSKLVTASFLHRHWKTIDWKLKTYLTIGTITIMFITSAGIYGFLSGAYSETSNKLEMHDGEVGILESKKEIFEKTIADNKTIIQDKLNDKKETSDRLDKRIGGIDYTKSNQSRNADKATSSTTKRLEVLDGEILELNNKNISLSDSVNKYNIQILEMKSNSDIASEVGPLKYIAKLTGYSMDSVVNFFILLLIFVFDPMAVCLVLATNISMEKIGVKTLADIVPIKKKTEEEEIEEEVEKEVEIKEDPIEENVETDQEYFDNINNFNDLDLNYLIDGYAESEIEKEKIEYKSNEEGEFVQQDSSFTMSADDAMKILTDIETKGIEINEKYQTFLEALFLNGSLNLGDTLPPYSQFVKELDRRGVEHEEKEVLDFLTICNLLKVTDMNGTDRRVAKDYSIAKGIFKVLSSK